jgi:hypothetical protein
MVYTNDPSGGLKVLGLLATVAAVSLGAPFWFDLLKSLVNVRMAGEKPLDLTTEKPSGARLQSSP